MRNTSIAENIAAGRRELGITQAALAERVGVTKAAVSKWELGQSLPDVAMLPRLASQLGVTLDELIGYGQELSDEEVSAIVREATGLSSTDRDAAVARCERELRDHGSSWNLLVAVAGLFAGWATTARAAGEEGAAAVLGGRADELCRRVVERSREPGEAFQARQIQATLLLSEGDAAAAAAMLEGMLAPGSAGVYLLLEGAYEKLGKRSDALALNRRHLAESAGTVLVEVMCMVNLADDAEEIARLAERGEEARSALGWALADADSIPSLRFTAAARLLELGEEATALNQLEVIAGEQQGDNTTQLARLLLGDESHWRDESLADRRLALLGRMQA